MFLDARFANRSYIFAHPLVKGFAIFEMSRSILNDYQISGSKWGAHRINAHLRASWSALDQMLWPGPIGDRLSDLVAGASEMIMLIHLYNLATTTLKVRVTYSGPMNLRWFCRKGSSAVPSGGKDYSLSPQSFSA